MQGILDAMSLYGLGTNQASRSRPTPHHAAQQLLGSLMGRGKLNALCALTVARFMLSNDVLSVLSRDAIQCIRCDGQTLSPLNSMTNPFPGELSALTSSGSSRDDAIIASTASLHRLSDAAAATPGESEVESTGLTHGILCVTATPDGRCIATGARNAVVTVWSSDLEPLHTLSGHTDWVRSVKFAHSSSSPSPSSELQLFSTGDDGVIFLWDPIDGAQLCRLEYTGSSGVQVFEVNFHSGLMAIAYNSPILALYRCRSDKVTHAQGDDVLRLQQISLITGAHRSTPTAAKFTEDSQWIASAAEDETLALSSVSEPRRIYVCSEFVTRRHCLTFMNTFNCIVLLAAPPFSSVIVLAACASDGTVVEWVVDPRDNRTSYTKTIQVHIGTLLSMDVIRRVC